MEPDYAAKKARVEHLYEIADGEVVREADEPEVVFCMDEFEPLGLLPHPGRQWADRSGKRRGPAVKRSLKADSRTRRWG
ncbi:hypothetical protein OG708_00740 [Streptomyces sp. NBC_01180]|nr:hypothetical protein OG708_00740 [Streptomyces sp. NBC_01180]